MLCDLEVANRAERDLADLERVTMLVLVEQLAVLGYLAATEQRPAAMLDRRFGNKGVVLPPFVMMLDRLAPPGERRRQPDVRRDLLRPQRARRPAALVDARLQQLRILEMAPAALQRQL